MFAIIACIPSIVITVIVAVMNVTIAERLTPLTPHSVRRLHDWCRLAVMYHGHLDFA